LFAHKELLHTSQYDVFTIGAGYIDLQAALSIVSSLPTDGLSMNSPIAVKVKKTRQGRKTAGFIIWIFVS